MTELTTCPSCHADLIDSPQFCEGCGVDLHPPLTATSGQAQLTAATCAACGGTADNDGYCRDCGRRLPTGRDHSELDVGIAAGVSDRGVRHPTNEDAIALAAVDSPRTVVAVVCDGVSTTEGAAQASLVAVQSGLAALVGDLRAGKAAEHATRAGVAAAAKDVAGLASGPHSPSCTYVSAIVNPDGGANAVTVGWLGDCRVFWIGAESAQLTTDDSWAAQMVVAGVMGVEEAYADPRSHIIVRWLGADAVDMEPTVAMFTPPGPGAIVVCSDGLWNYLPTPENLRDAAPDLRSDPLAAARDLVSLAIDAGGHDNITVAVIPVGDREPDGAATESEESHQ
jgi:serine/threonine protein phosphatase PrpC